MKNIKQFFLQNKRLTMLTIGSLMVQVIGTLAVPFLIGQLIDVGIASGNQQLVVKIGIQMLAVALIGGAGAVYGSYLSAKLAGKYGYDLRQAFYAKVQLLSIQEVESIGVPSLLTRMTNDVTNIQRSLVMFLQLILPAPLICLFAVIMTYLNSPKLALIPLVSIVIYSIVVGLLLKKGLPLSATIQVRLDRIMVKMREFFNGITVIRAFDSQDREEATTNQRFREYGASMVNVNRIFAYLTPVAYLIMGLVFALIIWVGGVLVGMQDIQIGTVTAVVEYSMQTLAYLIMAAMIIVTLPRSFASLQRIESVLEMIPEINDDIYQGTEIGKPHEQPGVFASFNRVYFAYNGAEPVLEELSFQLIKGQTTAIVGGTGSGKSTIAKLLLNLTQISSGEIIVEGTNLKQLSQADLRRKISYVPQKAFLFSGTIESNLRMGNPTASMEELERAIAIAQAREFVAQIDGGYQGTVTQGGTNFSGGQRQRLSMARALVKPANLYIFDDSFSALDYQTDAKLRQALKQEMQEATFLIVAQRLSTIQEADQIIVIDEGKIVGQGSHEVLLASNQTYREFALSQGFTLPGGHIDGK